MPSRFVVVVWRSNASRRPATRAGNPSNAASGAAAPLFCDEGYAGREFALAAAGLGAMVVRPKRKDERGRGPHLACPQ